jgi:hypothetical protein
MRDRLTDRENPLEILGNINTRKPLFFLSLFQKSNTHICVYARESWREIREAGGARRPATAARGGDAAATRRRSGGDGRSGDCLHFLKELDEVDKSLFFTGVRIEP